MEYIYIGKIISTHGIKGELKILSNSEKKDIIFKKGNKLYIGNNYTEEVINSYRTHKGYDMVTFLEYDNINQVLKYLKSSVYVKKSELNLEENDYLLEELIGFSIVKNGVKVGILKEIIYNKGNVLLYVEASKNFYIPNNDYFIKKVNLENKEIEVLNIEGLML